jgi:hypothetical protein
LALKESLHSVENVDKGSKIREKPNIPLRLHDSIQREITKGATEPLFIASEALRDVEFNPETWD